MNRLSPSAVKHAIACAAAHTGSEIALVDVREHGEYGEGHPFFSVNLPYSRLELLAPGLLPSRHTPIVVFDGNDGVAERAGAVLASMGYRDVSVLDGGTQGWSATGSSLFKGVNLPSKAFGELVELALHTPHMDAATLNARLAAGDDLVVLDGRTAAEFTKMSIPKARSCPNAELPLRIRELVGSDETTIVVNCAGRTRSIIGAENLRALGLNNPIHALENGTQGWMLAGLALDNGQVPQALPDLDEESLGRAAAAALAFSERFSIPTIGEAELVSLRAAKRCVYLLDVRSSEEYDAGHVPGSVHAPGGQLAQATDQWVAARGAKIVLLDDLKLRAYVTARWLRGMGHDACVAEFPDDAFSETGPMATAAPGGLAIVDVAELDRHRLIDVSPGMRYREAHLAGAVWAIRPRVTSLALDRDKPICLVADEPGVASLAAGELENLGYAVAGYHPRDVKAWQAAGLRIESTPNEPRDEACIDYLFFVHDRHDGNLDAARAYLSWETGLIEQMAADERALLDPR